MNPCKELVPYKGIYFGDINGLLGNLPIMLLFDILGYMTKEEARTVKQTCKLWYNCYARDKILRQSVEKNSPADPFHLILYARNLWILACYRGHENLRHTDMQETQFCVEK